LVRFCREVTGGDISGDSGDSAPRSVLTVVAAL
jgi:hypothetical protein